MIESMYCKNITLESGPRRSDTSSVPLEPDYVSIDLDTADIWIFEQLAMTWRPRVVSVEYNAAFPPHSTVAFPDASWMPVSPPEAAYFNGNDAYMASSAGALVHVAGLHHYKLVNLTMGLDLFFVRDDLWPWPAVSVAAAQQLCAPTAAAYYTKLHAHWYAPMRPEHAANLVDVAVLRAGGSLCAARAAAWRALLDHARAEPGCRAFQLLTDSLLPEHCPLDVTARSPVAHPNAEVDVDARGGATVVLADQVLPSSSGDGPFALDRVLPDLVLLLAGGAPLRCAWFRFSLGESRLGLARRLHEYFAEHFLATGLDADLPILAPLTAPPADATMGLWAPLVDQAIGQYYTAVAVAQKRHWESLTTPFATRADGKYYLSVAAQKARSKGAEPGPDEELRFVPDEVSCFGQPLV
jgi:hypothetical protein